MCVMAPPIHLGTWSMVWLPFELVGECTALWASRYTMYGIHGSESFRCVCFGKALHMRTFRHKLNLNVCTCLSVH